MTLDLFFKNFELLADAPHGVQKLRELILQLAVQGKLVPQDSSDEPASLVLKRIRVEREHLVKAKKINKARAVTHIDDDEVPCELPGNWEWVRLAEVGHDWRQKKPDMVFTYIDVSSINREQGIISDNTNVLQPGEAPSRARKLVCKGTVIYATVRPYLLNIAIVDRQFEPEPIVSTAFAVIHPFSGILNKYLYYYLRSKSFVQYVEAQMKGMAYPAINDGQLYEGLIAIPPSNEQKRIVAKVEQLMKLCDDLEERQRKRRSHLTQINEGAITQLLTAATPDKFSDRWQRICNNFDLLYSLPENISKLRRAILQLAVQGKLVPQDPNDELVSTLQEKVEAHRKQLIKDGKIERPKFLHPVEIDEAPFEIPESWKWVKLGSLLIFGPKNGYSPKAVDYATEVKSLTLSATTSGEFNEHHFKYLDEEIAADSPLWLEDGDLLIQRGNTIEYVGVAAVYKGLAHEFIHPDLMMKLRFSKYINVDYLHHVINSNSSRQFFKARATGTSGSMPKINQMIVSNLPIPLPPLEEQHRIVAKVNRLMELCNELEARLLQTQTNSESLMKAAVHEVLSV